MPVEPSLAERAFSLADLAFYGLAALCVGCGLYAVLSRNIVRAVFALLGTFLGTAGLYACLAADFVAVVQLLVYVGGILVLMLFAVMLTSHIEVAFGSNRYLGPSATALGLLLGAGAAVMLVALALQAPWARSAAPLPYEPTTADLGRILLGPGLLPFELLGVVLLAVVVGAVVIARREEGDR
jgi:NAD(P)H-quinone oxidoreductase subunit 6